MTEILLPPNHIAMMVKFLAPYFPKGAVRADEPTSASYDPKSLLILVKDGGASSPQAHTFWHCMSTFEVRHGNRTEAKKFADKVDALLRADISDDLTYLGSLNAPTFDPELELGVPSYSFTMEHAVRGIKTTTEALTQPA